MNLQTVSLGFFIAATKTDPGYIRKRKGVHWIDTRYSQNSQEAAGLGWETVKDTWETGKVEHQEPPIGPATSTVQSKVCSALHMTSSSPESLHYLLKI